MKKIIILFVLTVFFMTGCTRSGVDKIVIGVDEEFPPMGFRDAQGRLVGFDIDLAKETFKYMDAGFEFKVIDWKQKEDELNAGNIDMIWNGLNITPDRKERLLFSKPYMDNRQILLTKRDNDLKIYSEYDLAGKIVGIQAGTAAEAYLNQNEDIKQTFAGLKTYPSFESALKALIGNEYEVLIIDELAGRYEMNKNVAQLKVIDVTVGSSTGIGIGFRKNDVALRDKVQKAFDKMVADGKAKKISEQWFNSDLIKSIK